MALNRSRSTRRVGFRLALLLGCSFPILAHANVSRFTDASGLPDDPPPPVNTFLDPAQVDLASGSLNVSDAIVTIGDPAQGGLQWVYHAGLARDNFYGAVNNLGNNYTVSLGDASYSFTRDPNTGAFSSTLGDGVQLSYDNAATYTATLRDGTIATFSTTWRSNNYTQAAARVISIQTPTGVITTFSYKRYLTRPPTAVRLQGVSNNLGYAIKFTYQTNNNSASDGVLTQVKGVNLAVDFCDISADSCTTPSFTWPTATITALGTATAIVDPANRTTTYPIPFPSYTGTLSRPGGPNWSITFDSAARVASMTNGVGTWTYTYSTTSGPDDGATGPVTANPTTTVTDPMTHTHVVVTSATFGTTLSDTDGAGHSTTYTYDRMGRLVSAISPEGVKTTRTYDSRGNITQTQTFPKSGSPLAVRTTSGGYDTTCTYAAKCNEPNWTKDALNYQTDYSYDGPTGLLQYLSPPAGANGLRSTTMLNYAQVTPYFKNASGVQTAGTPIWKLGSTVNCSTAQFCPANSPDATIVNYGYGYGNPAGTPNNLLLTITSQMSGDQPTSVYRQRTFAYDSVGNMLTATDWNGNTTRFRYNADRSVAGAVGPDPDGGGSLRNRAVRYTYDAGGRLQKTERGVANSESDADWLNFTPLAVDTVSFDGLGRATQETVGAQGAPALASVTNYAYDAADRLLCTAVRMNSPNNFANLPASACQLGSTGPYGPDRITYLGYDGADRVTSTTTGYQTSWARTESSTTYTPDGLVQTQTDAKGNKTTFTYDGFDRLSQVNFPTPSNGGVSNGADYILYSYDANGSLTGRRNRDTSTVTYGYDGAGRLSSRSGTTLAATSFTYDNLGRVKTAVSGGQTLTFTYDVLGRKLTEAGPFGSVGSQYDANGNRTRLQWPDGTYATYTYDAANEMTNITDGSGTQLSYLTYDDLGRRTAAYMKGLTSCEGWGYGPDLRLSAITIQPTCGTVTESYGYYYNAAGQLRASTSSNSAFDWTSSVGNVGRGYATDGLNRYTTSGGAALTYDGLGDVINDTRLSYTFDGLNKLVSMSNGATFSYDGLDRLRYTFGSVGTNFLYDGDTIIAEYDNGGNVLNRYVPGAAKDEFAAWYAAPGAGGYAGRQYLQTDRQGSPVAIVNDSGTLIAINTYDESGQPGSGNRGRFSYTGAPYVPEADLLHMRARDYSFRLGRFMQPDPIGYGDGLNFYDYVHSDPLNLWDPYGKLTVTAMDCGASAIYENPHGDDGHCVPLPRPQTTRSIGPALGGLGAISLAGGSQNTPNPDPCAGSDSALGKLGESLDSASDFADDVALGAGLGAAALSETVVGGAVLGGVALGSEVISKVETVGAVFVKLFDGNLRGAGTSLLAFAVGQATAKGLSGVAEYDYSVLGNGKPTRFQEKMGEVVGHANSKATESIVCHRR